MTQYRVKYDTWEIGRFTRGIKSRKENSGEFTGLVELGRFTRGIETRKWSSGEFTGLVELFGWAVGENKRLKEEQRRRRANSVGISQEQGDTKRAVAGSSKRVVALLEH